MIFKQFNKVIANIIKTMRLVLAFGKALDYLWDKFQ